MESEIENRMREIVAEEIEKLSLKVTVTSDGYGSTYYVSAYLKYKGATISESDDSFMR
jgi:hypothetical protein